MDVTRTSRMDYITTNSLVLLISICVGVILLYVVFLMQLFIAIGVYSTQTNPILMALLTTIYSVVVAMKLCYVMKLCNTPKYPAIVMKLANLACTVPLLRELCEIALCICAPMFAGAFIMLNAMYCNAVLGYFGISWELK